MEVEDSSAAVFVFVSPEADDDAVASSFADVVDDDGLTGFGAFGTFLFTSRRT